MIRSKPSDWLNVARKARRVAAGDEFSAEVQGGFCRGRAEGLGVVVSDGRSEIFVPDAVLRTAGYFDVLERMKETALPALSREHEASWNAAQAEASNKRKRRRK